MICKKCGANIADTSKFCGYCGNSVSEPVNNPQPNVELNNVGDVGNSTNTVNETDLGKTIKIEPVQSVNEIPIAEPTNNDLVPPIGPGLPGNEVPQSNTPTQPITESVTSEPVVENNIGNQTNNQVNQSMNNQSTVDSSIQNQAPVNGPVVQNNANNTKKNNKLIFIIGGIALAIVAIVVVVFAFMKSSNNSISVLKKAIANLEEKGQNSATVDAKMSLATSTGESLSFTATAKVEKKNEDIMDMQIIVNESLLFEEMNIYASLDKEEVTMYMESSLIDMMGTTSSVTPMWVYYTLALDEVMGESTQESVEGNVEEIKLEDLIDEKHFVYVDTTNEMKHYQLIIDQELIDTMKAKLADVDDQDIKDMLDTMEPLEETIKIDFYINNSNELSKIELDMSEYLEDSEDISSFVIGIEFRDLNNTKVEIPSDAKSATYDLETYMMDYASTDFDYSYDTDYDYNYDNMYDTSLDSSVYGF